MLVRPCGNCYWTDEPGYAEKLGGPGYSFLHTPPEIAPNVVLMHSSTDTTCIVVHTTMSAAVEWYSESLMLRIYLLFPPFARCRDTEAQTRGKGEAFTLYNKAIAAMYPVLSTFLPKGLPRCVALVPGQERERDFHVVWVKPNISLHLMMRDRRRFRSHWSWDSHKLIRSTTRLRGSGRP